MQKLENPHQNGKFQKINALISSSISNFFPFIPRFLAGFVVLLVVTGISAYLGYMVYMKYRSAKYETNRKFRIHYMPF